MTWEYCHSLVAELKAFSFKFESMKQQIRPDIRLALPMDISSFDKAVLIPLAQDRAA